MFIQVKKAGLDLKFGKLQGVEAVHHNTLLDRKKVV